MVEHNKIDTGGIDEIGDDSKVYEKSLADLASLVKYWDEPENAIGENLPGEDMIKKMCEMCGIPTKDIPTNPMIEFVREVSKRAKAKLDKLPSDDPESELPLF